MLQPQSQRVIGANRLVELLDASGLLNADTKAALLAQYSGKLFDMRTSARLFAASLTGLVEDPEAIEFHLSAIDKATDQIVAALCGAGPSTVCEWLEWEHPGQLSVARYALAPHAACLRLIVLESFEAAANTEAPQERSL